jgi:hypothetical protein
MSSSRSCRAVAGRVAAQHVPPPPMMQPSPVRARSHEPGARSPGPTLSKRQTACTDQGAPQGGRVHVQTGPGRPVAACTSKPDPDSMRQMRRFVPPSWARVALGQFAGLPSQRRGRRAHGPARCSSFGGIYYKPDCRSFDLFRLPKPVIRYATHERRNRCKVYERQSPSHAQTYSPWEAWEI